MKCNHGTSHIVPIVRDSKYSECFTDVFTKEGEYRMHEGSLINASASSSYLGGTPSNGLYREVPPKKAAFFRVR